MPALTRASRHNALTYLLRQGWQLLLGAPPARLRLHWPCLLNPRRATEMGITIPRLSWDWGAPAQGHTCAPAECPCLSVSLSFPVPHCRPLPSSGSGCPEGQQPTAHAHLPSSASYWQSPPGPLAPRLPQGLCSPASQCLGAPRRQFICNALAGFPRASEKRLPVPGAGNTSERN